MSRGRPELIVVGGGHAGIEAALAAARMGASVHVVTLDRRSTGRMSCNPAIGGIGKGQIVREIDALGGEMGYATDACMIQFRMLNTRKGPAVQAPRAQCDRHRYQQYMCRATSAAPGVQVHEGKVEALLIDRTGGGAPVGRVAGVRLEDGSEIRSRAVVVTSGTFLRGLLHCGSEQTVGGRMGEQAARGLSDFLVEVGFERGRLKTGTPPRVDRATVDWSLTEVQPGDDPPVPFSHRTTRIPLPQVPCHIAYTNARTHDIIRENLHRAPMYSGAIRGVGPRYCPSIEDKVVRFRERNRHQIFLEPEGLDTSWIYLNGISTSLPRDVQDAILRSIPALHRARVHQYGYAVEYDFFPPTQIDVTYETRAVKGLYFAGQICGTSGYEEAAAQGLLAGINAVQAMRGEEPFVLDRSEGYLGVLTDDLVRECPREPYRMFTSRAEYRLLLRADNADLRLMDAGHRLGLISEEARERLEKKRRGMDGLRRLLERRRVEGKLLVSYLRRPGVTVRDVLALAGDHEGMPVDADAARQVEIEVKYEAYIERQAAQVDRFRRLEKRRIPVGIDYGVVVGLSREAREKLAAARPRSLGQASRMGGVTPADVSVLMTHIERRSRSGLRDTISRGESPSPLDEVVGEVVEEGR